MGCEDSQELWAVGGGGALVSAPHVTKPALPAGDPLQCGAWVGQCALYIVIMIFEKSVVFIVLLILQWKKVCLLFPSLPAPQDAKQDSTSPPQPYWETKLVVVFFNSMNAPGLVLMGQLLAAYQEQ